MKTIASLFAVLSMCFVAAAQEAPPRPLRLAVAGLTHGHAPMILGRADRGDVQIVGIYEPRVEVFKRYAQKYNLAPGLLHSDLARMLDEVKPEAVAAFGPTFDHLAVVEACAPRGIHVMVEKPLAVNLRHAFAIADLARRHNIRVMTNYETTWYASNQAVYDALHGERTLGPLRKVVVHDGHMGPKEINVPPEFFEWLTDPARNGGGALMDFGCYGANLTTWLMNGEEPLAVTAVTQQIKPDIYPAVEDEATIVLRYRDAQAIIQASWNWPTHRKDLEVYGRDGYAFAVDGRNVRLRSASATQERSVALERRANPFDDPFAYFAAVIRGRVTLADSDLSSLANNLTVMRILDAAQRSAVSGRTTQLTPLPGIKRGGDASRVRSRS